ncbi:MAG: undecaprenyl/decaprenyl-phosphate alpha-N-acetylglucosaminyl 1-phosphate transferase [Clostridium sp.]|nr:undecaprenyl/decaprenyl-phosphate alpha-N-acetylglucosaminyl 1-phosphate transferase [Clostridium sp.]
MLVLTTLIALSTAAAAGAVIIPSILRISAERDIYDLPDERKIHHDRVSRLGGVSFMPAILFALALAVSVNLLFFDSDMFVMPARTIALVGLGICSLVAIYVVGLADDMIGVRYSAKFVVQIFAALCMTVSGTTIGSLNGCLGIYELHPAVAFFLTALVVVFITNAINLIDGLDGLAGGICALIALYDAIILYHAGAYIFALLAIATFGVLIPFLCFNLLGRADRGTKIFMGDTGSLSLGIIISFLCVVIANTEITFTPTMQPDSLAIAFAPLLVPCLDLLRVFIGRIRRHQSPFLPDKTHIHHRLLAAGLRQRTTLMIIMLFTLFFAIASVIASVWVNVGWVLLGDIVLFTLLQVWLGKQMKQS